MSNEEDELKQLLDDDDIRRYFQGRDPERKKPNPGLTEDIAEQIQGKASALTPKEVKNEDDVHGVSFSQHIKSVRETKKHYIWIGICAGLTIAIILVNLMR